MGGGLLNLIANTQSTNANIYFIGNPSSCFFTTRYNQYCDFAKQKFRIDYNGSNTLQQNISTNITFKISRNADLLTDTYLVLTLPDIYSPIIDMSGSYASYDFKWIKDIGTNIIKEITIKIDGAIIQQYSGAYIKNVVERDYDSNKKDIFNKMTGNVPELHSPSITTHSSEFPNSYQIYPNSIDENSSPSIKSRQLYIPINSWFTLSKYLAFPLISLQYQNLFIEFTLRPLSELYIVRDLSYINQSKYSLTPYISPSKFPSPNYNLSTFLTSSDGPLSYNSPPPVGGSHNYDIHIICTQIFLSEDQRLYFTNNSHSYLLHDIREHIIYDIVGSTKIDIESHSLIANWTWHLQRSDIDEKNEWSNYTNWLTQDKNINGIEYIYDLSMTSYHYDQSSNISDLSNIYCTPIYNSIHEKEILLSFAIICDGAYRENIFPNGVHKYLDIYNTSNGNSKDGLYFYSLILDNNLSKIQPSGVFNTNFFKKTEFEIKTLIPPIDPSGSTVTVNCDDDGNIISINKNNNSLYKYTYTMTIQEERYNILTFSSGMANLEFSR